MRGSDRPLLTKTSHGPTASAALPDLQGMAGEGRGGDDPCPLDRDRGTGADSIGRSVALWAPEVGILAGGMCFLCAGHNVSPERLIACHCMAADAEASKQYCDGTDITVLCRALGGTIGTGIGIVSAVLAQALAQTQLFFHPPRHPPLPPRPPHGL